MKTCETCVYAKAQTRTGFHKRLSCSVVSHSSYTDGDDCPDCIKSAAAVIDSPDWNVAGVNDEDAREPLLLVLPTFGCVLHEDKVTE